jgi:hypothetical protein
VANSVMLINRPHTVWTANLDDFIEAARGRWPDAQIGRSNLPSRYPRVAIQLMADGVGLDGAFALDDRGEGYLSIRSGVNRPAAEMFAWARDWLGPDNECSLVETGNGEPTVDVPYGATTDQVQEILATL